MDIETKFYMQAARSLAGCQLVEQALKLYITEALRLARTCIGASMPFRMAGDDYDNMALGGMTDVFGKLSDNSLLTASLRAFARERNFLTHRAIASCLDPDGELDYPGVTNLSARLVRIEERLKDSQLLCTRKGARFALL